MSEPNGTPWGMCAAYGCPLPGTVGSESRWYCFCHVNKPSNFNDAITRELREKQKPIVDAIAILRVRGCSFYGSDSEYRAIQQLLIGADRRDLLMSADEKQTGGARAWLQRLERALIDACAGFGQQKPIPLAVPTAPVIGPTHASNFHPYADGDAA
ncbi:hypothetical protein C9I56_11280 [Paraburkholderia caribensis]|uniref:hypothetical protein n=1 Tax=Paraburkholderia caribensis TaxID=75105 RepID=UPI000D156DB7|nr:hypothetical protein [Paraburkholderia caribensis]PTB28864.1 hypothetical protein C9I56_11280 [Paraburkholderia caribensis]